MKRIDALVASKIKISLIAFVINLIVVLFYFLIERSVGKSDDISVLSDVRPFLVIIMSLIMMGISLLGLWEGATLWFYRKRKAILILALHLVSFTFSIYMGIYLIFHSIVLKD